MQQFPYPPAPPTAIVIKPSPAFKKAAIKVIGAIIAFLLVYLLLVAGALGLVALSIYGGLMIISVLTNFFGLAIGLGLMALGISIVVFLVKFLFASSKNEDPRRIQLFEADEPQLFAFIRQLAKDTNTKMPKKVFISPDVNACVFYNSSFWSMFFPVRKNLEIGLGLVNSVNISEFKAIMAHEFGHFSQQSMKLGSFTYNVNRVIYNMLYENTGYARFINSWAQIDGILGLFAEITAAIARGIQYILRGMYQLINKHYMGLSRQMEYNADAIAASVAGTENIVHSLYRIDLSQSCFNTTLQKADELLKQEKKMENIYVNHTSVLQHCAHEFKLPLVNGLPEVSSSFIQSFSKSRVNYKDQWASHPSNEEREKELLALNLHSKPDPTSAWVLFRNPLALQQQVTENMYASIENNAALTTIEAEDFAAQYHAEMERYSLPATYRNYYNSRYIDASAWSMAGNGDEEATVVSLKDFDSAEIRLLPEMLSVNEKDLAVLKAIQNREIDVKRFDFDGEKYNRDAAPEIIARLEAEIAAQKTRLANLDRAIYNAACHRALALGSDHAESMEQTSNSYRTINAVHLEFFELCNNIMQHITPFHQGNCSLEHINRLVQELRDGLMVQLKAQLRTLQADAAFMEAAPATLKAKMDYFLQKEYYFFVFNEFQNDELDQLIGICNEVTQVLGEMKWTAYKNMLVHQEQLLQPA